MKSSSTANGASSARPAGFWSILNSPFTLFLLSSVVLGGIARIYTDRQQQAERERVREQEAIKVATELDYRVTQLGYLAGRLGEKGLSDPERVAIGVFIWRAVTGDAAFQPTMPDFRTVHMLALVSRLKLLGLGGDLREIAAALAIVEYDKDPAWHYNEDHLRRSVDVLAAYRNAINRQVAALRMA